MRRVGVTSRKDTCGYVSGVLTYLPILGELKSRVGSHVHSFRTLTPERKEEEEEEEEEEEDDDDDDDDVFVRE